MKYLPSNPSSLEIVPACPAPLAQDPIPELSLFSTFVLN